MWTQKTKHIWMITTQQKKRLKKKLIDFNRRKSIFSLFLLRFFFLLFLTFFLCFLTVVFNEEINVTSVNSNSNYVCFCDHNALWLKIAFEYQKSELMKTVFPNAWGSVKTTLPAILKHFILQWMFRICGYW